MWFHNSLHVKDSLHLSRPRNQIRRLRSSSVWKRNQIWNSVHLPGKRKEQQNTHKRQNFSLRIHQRWGCDRSSKHHGVWQQLRRRGGTGSREFSWREIWRKFAVSRRRPTEPRRQQSRHHRKCGRLRQQWGRECVWIWGEWLKLWRDEGKRVSEAFQAKNMFVSCSEQRQFRSGEFWNGWSLCRVAGYRGRIVSLWFLLNTCSFHDIYKFFIFSLLCETFEISWDFVLCFSVYMYPANEAQTKKSKLKIQHSGSIQCIL